MNLKSITDNAWLLIAEGTNENVGLLSKDHNGYLLMANQVKIRFESESEINDFFKVDIFKNVVESSEQQIEYYVKGYPVKYDNPYEVDPENKITDLPLYSKSKDSNIFMCAGYYCIDFPKGPVTSYCPKYATLMKYGYHGPFKTMYDVKQELARLKTMMNIV